MSDKLHVDGTLAAAQRAIELQAENETLRAKLAEHETLFAYATHRDDFLEQILVGLGPNLPPYTPRTVEGIVSAVANMALELDAHRDASVPAFDEIVQLCGLAKTWEYPGQVIRDVADSIKRRDDKIAELREQLRIAEAVRDDARRASTFDLEKRRDALETAEACREDQRALAKRRDELLATIARLSQTLPFPDEWKDWEGQRAKLIAEVGTMRNRVATLEELAREDHLTAIKRNGAMLTKIKELTEQKDGAYDERDRCVVGLAAFAVNLGWDAWLGRHEPDPKWDQDWMNIVFIHTPAGQVSWHIHDNEVEWFSFLKNKATSPDHKWDGHTTPQKYERLGVALKALLDVGPRHSRECGTRYRGCAPDCAFAAAQDVKHNPVVDTNLAALVGCSCGYRSSSEDDLAQHLGIAKIGNVVVRHQHGPTLGGEDLSPDPVIRRAQIEAVVMGDDPGVEYTTDLICGCSLKYREMSPGVHAKYCSLAGQPLKPFVVEPAPGQCPWILDDEDPDEGYWHCAHDADHVGVHETAFGKGRDQRWKMRGNLLPGDTSKAIKPPRAP